MHERSRTILRDGKWINVYGPGTPTPGIVLEPQFHFEKWAYESEAEASAAAQARSDRWREVEIRAPKPAQVSEE